MEKQKDIKELLGIVGKDRGKYSDAVIAEAEKAIEARWGKAQDMLRKRILRAGSITSLIGVVMLGAGLLGVFMLVDMYEGFWDYGSSEDSAKEIWFCILMTIAILLETLAGLGLVVGGIAFRKGREWSRRVIAAVIILGLCYAVIASIVWEIQIVVVYGLDKQTVLLAIMGVLVFAFWSALLWLALRFFRLAEVREYCRRQQSFDYPLEG